MHDTGCLGLVHWDEGSGWGTHVYLWQIHFDIWQKQYNIVKLKNKIKLKKKTFIAQQTLQRWFWDMSPPSPQVASLLNKANLLFLPALVSQIQQVLHAVLSC